MVRCQSMRVHALRRDNDNAFWSCVTEEVPEATTEAKKATGCENESAI